jgi:hypothetical protein
MLAWFQHQMPTIKFARRVLVKEAYGMAQKMMQDSSFVDVQRGMVGIMPGPLVSYQKLRNQLP